MASVGTLKPIPATEDVPKYEGPGEYDGPSPGWLIAKHKLAHQIIACHPIESMRVLDPEHLVFLRQYLEHPGNGTEFLREQDMLDKPGDKPGNRAQMKYGNLIGYAIANNAFNDDEIKLLQGWFDSGVLDKELEGVEYQRKPLPGWNED
jgi:hypothetical protein